VSAVAVWRQRRRGIAKWSGVMVEGRRSKVEGRRSKAEGRRPKAEG
jgi:hypothetical protein